MLFGSNYAVVRCLLQLHAPKARWLFAMAARPCLTVMSTPSSCRISDAYTHASSLFAILKDIKQLAPTPCCTNREAKV